MIVMIMIIMIIIIVSMCVYMYICTHTRIMVLQYIAVYYIILRYII